MSKHRAERQSRNQQSEQSARGGVAERHAAPEPGTTGARLLIDSLIAEGVDTIFGYPGGAIMPVYDALHGANDVRHVLVRHEQGATHAAQGYARTTLRPGVCLATSGPGATNFITGLADALMDSTPLVCIAGQVATSKLGTEAFQEADIIGMTLSATKWSYQITRAEEIPAAVARAFEVACTGRPGPVMLEITRDAQTALVDPGAAAPLPPCLEHPITYPSAHSDLSEVPEAARLINEAERPYLMIGQGVLLSGAERQVRELAERADIPVASTLLGLSALPTEHPLNVGLLGMHGNYGPNRLTNEADVIIAVGMRFDDRVTGRLDRYARQARIIHIEIDPAEVNRRVPATVALVEDAATALEALLAEVLPARHDAWRERFAEHDEVEHREVVAGAVAPDHGPLQMGEVVNRLGERTAGRAIVVSDVGQHQMAAARHSRFSEPNSHITSGGLGTMGFALPAALGAAMGAPERVVVAVIGDGGFQMTMQELATLAQERAAVKIVVLNNEHLGMVRQWQEMFFDQRYSSVQMTNPDFVTLARAFGIEGATVSDRNALDDHIDRMLATPGPYLLEVRVERAENVFPMVPAGAGVDEIRLS